MASSRSIAITYVPADCGSVIPGKSKSPQAFRDVNIVSRLRAAGIPQILEYHALEEPVTFSLVPLRSGKVRNEDLNVSVCERVKSTVLTALSAPTSRPAFQIILGGECCMLPGILEATWQHVAPKRVGLLYIDADTDLSSPTDADSTGNFAGMNMTHLVRHPGALESMNQFSQPNGAPVCDASNTVLFGTNMSLPGNKREHFAYLFDNNYKVVTSASIARNPEQRAKEALKFLEEKVDTIMLHLDVDAIDPQTFPLANVPNFTGVRFEQMMVALAVFLGSDKVGGLTVAEVNPDHDPGLEMTEQLTTEVIRMLAARVENMREHTQFG
ncbi:Arginase/deacetylase [Setomelanomma holmii]|uniref:Arginase/deacetylase n=1 Tax=Setomelanomma holmii TaxID=210430 RepID=A0A9P4GZU7_9PLEO|nr:Arginase/deacetylase [Setomelanomma holmii]